MSNLTDNFKQVAGFITGAAIIPLIPIVIYSGHLPFMGDSNTPRPPQAGLAGDLKISPPSNVDYSEYAGIVNNPMNDSSRFVPHSSLPAGGNDEREPVMMDKPEYYAVASFSIYNEILGLNTYRTSACTATLTEFETHDTLDNKDTVTLAAHCVLAEDEITPYSSSQMGVSFHYVDNNGAIKTFETSIVDYDYQYDTEYNDDRAIALLKDKVPDEIKPAIMKVDYQPSEEEVVSNIGRSADKKGLHKDPVTTFNDFRTTYHFEQKECHSAPGASGGPGSIGVINDHLVVVSTNSNVLDGMEICGSHIYTKDFLDQVPFLARRVHAANVTPDKVRTVRAFKM